MPFRAHHGLRSALVAPRDAVQEREPLLGLDLSIDLPLTNVINSILNPGATTTKTKTSTPTPAQTPTATIDPPPPAPPQPTTTAGSSSSGGGSDGGGGGSDGGGGGSDGGGGGSDSGGSGAGAGTGTGAATGPAAPSATGAAAPSAGTGAAPPPTGSSAGDPSAAAAGGDGTAKTTTGGVFAVNTGVANAGSNPNTHPTGPTSYLTIAGKTVAVVGTVTFSNGLPTATDASGNPVDPGAGGSGSTPGGGGGGKRGVPGYVGAVVGVLGALILLGLLIFVIRKRALSKRAARRAWWTAFSRPKSDGNWSASDHATAGDSACTKSIRSSFGTTFDHSEFSITFDDNVPAVPAMAEIRGGPSIVPKGDPSMPGNGQPLSPITPISPFSPTLPAIPLLVNIENSNVYSDANRRVSAGSNLSSASAQYLSYDRANGATNNQLLEAPTPMSVRPFSPSESFAFPAPPRESRSTLQTPLVPEITETLAAPAPAPTPVVSENPFADAFAVPVAAAARASAEFDAVETIWRAFEQTLQDEMSVCAGDRVKVLGVYDDGWAMVERVDMGKGKGKAPDGQASVGLIPLDCMRKANESVVSFLAAKRVSSVDATGYVASAV